MKQTKYTDYISGNEAAAIGAQRARVEVVAAYPITPATTVPETLADLCAEGHLDARYMAVESEHSAMAACIGAAMSGARAFTATSSQGLLLMNEMLYWAAGARLPIVMANVNRALCAPWALWADHNDSMSVRDSGWMQFYCEDAQDVLDTILMSYRLAEKWSIPAMVVYEGFLVSHSYESVIIPSAKDVDAFLPKFEPRFRLDPDEPHSFGNLLLPTPYAETRYLFHEDMKKIIVDAKKVEREYRKATGLGRSMVVEEEKKSASIAILAMGSMVSTIREAVDNIEDATLVKLKCFRPFPAKQLERILSKYEKVVVVDRGLSCGQGGHLWQEIRNALYGSKGALNKYDLSHRPPRVLGYVTGLNGEDVTPSVISQIITNARRRSNDTMPIMWRRK